ncbi:MAG: hypothetical protein C6I00_05275 [Nitratiruptor sp.]|nr:hypothetical protein [Nitratiruptor sp.]NPA83510.1 c-type cytochrome [Campylobacterota bacterium]
MVRHFIALVAAVVSLGAILYMAKLDMEIDKLAKIQEVIERSKLEVPLQHQSQGETKQKEQQREESAAERKLKVLKEKAGPISAFEVSPLYRRNCASCHGINGEGGIGPKLIGRSQEYIYQALMDFKSGKRKNYVMYGLLQNIGDDELRALAQEIASFATKLQAAR